MPGCLFSRAFFIASFSLIGVLFLADRFALIFSQKLAKYFWNPVDQMAPIILQFYKPTSESLIQNSTVLRFYQIEKLCETDRFICAFLQEPM